MDDAHDPLEVITGELENLNGELARQRREAEHLAQNAEIRLRAMELHLDQPLRDKLWQTFVVLMLATAVISVAACMILVLYWMTT